MPRAPIAQPNAPSRERPFRPRLPVFEDHLRSSVQDVRAALAEVMASIAPPLDATRPQDTARRVGLDKSLSWKLSRILMEEDAIATVPLMPGRAGLGIAIRGFTKVGASKRALDHLQTAIDEFDRMVEVHCGDRDTLEMMLGHLHRDNNQAAAQDEIHRKKSFQGNSAIWGAQARVQICSHFVAPSSDPDQCDIALVTGLIDLRRLRQDVPWAISTLRRYHDDGTEFQRVRIEPIDERVKPGEVPLMRDFCSQPLAEMRIAPEPRPPRKSDGFTRHEIVEGPVGSTAACTAISGFITRGDWSRWRTEHDDVSEFVVSLVTPAELLIHDLYVHRDLRLPEPPEVCLYSALPSGPVYPDTDRARGVLPSRETLIELGSPPASMVPELPQYRDIVETVFKRLGNGRGSAGNGANWSAKDFVGYRRKMKFPPIPTREVFRHPLPVKP